MPKGTTLKETVETRSYDKQFFLWANSLHFWVAPRMTSVMEGESAKCYIILPAQLHDTATQSCYDLQREGC
jgi:hypothetical protein